MLDTEGAVALSQTPSCWQNRIGPVSIIFLRYPRKAITVVHAREIRLLRCRENEGTMRLIILIDRLFYVPCFLFRSCVHFRAEQVASSLGLSNKRERKREKERVHEGRGQQTLISLSRISQLKIPGFCRFRSSILASTSGVATRGLLPPITPGLIEPVS